MFLYTFLPVPYAVRTYFCNGDDVGIIWSDGEMSIGLPNSTEIAPVSQLAVQMTRRSNRGSHELHIMG
jgi:hypothetical protein